MLGATNHRSLPIEVMGDSKLEADAKYHLDLFGDSSNTLFAQNRVVGTILNDD
jgi:hypothetical protein